MKKSLDGLSSRMERTEERIGEVEDKPVEFPQSE